METSSQPVVLCVDDEPQILEGLSVHLRRRYQVLTATSGVEGLQALSSHLDAAVVISDMRMPVMDGAIFLRRARELAPDTVRLLLTGHADLDSAVAAINQGHIFRFISKPCPTALLLSSMEDAMEHHRLITAERVLLEQTVRGIIKTLTDVLALTNPVSFGRASRIKTKVSELASALDTPEPWQAEVAAMLSQLGYIALEPETADRVYHGQQLSPEEEEAVARVPAITEQLLGNIPRLEVVRGILASYARPYRKPGLNDTDPRSAQIHRGAQLLKVAIDFDAHESTTGSGTTAIDIMRGRADQYDPKVLAVLQTLLGPDSTYDIKEVKLSELKVGMLFDEDVRMDSGTLMVARGLEVTPGMVERMRNRRGDFAKELVRVIIPRPPVS